DRLDSRKGPKQIHMRGTEILIFPLLPLKLFFVFSTNPPPPPPPPPPLLAGQPEQQDRGRLLINFQLIVSASSSVRTAALVLSLTHYSSNTNCCLSATRR